MLTIISPTCMNIDTPSRCSVVVYSKRVNQNLSEPYPTTATSEDKEYSNIVTLFFSS